MGLRPRAVPPKPVSGAGKLAALAGGSFGQAQVLLRRAWSCVSWALVLRAKALRVIRWGTSTLCRIYELLRLAGDPDWRRYTTSTWSFSKGVPLGVDVRLPRTPALFPRKCKHRIYPEADHVFDGELRDNYSSARESAEQIERQFQQEIELGAMVRYDLDQARAEFGDELVVASLGAAPKADQSVRVVHDATHGLHVNDRIRVRDAQTTRIHLGSHQNSSGLSDWGRSEGGA